MNRKEREKEMKHGKRARLSSLSVERREIFARLGGSKIARELQGAALIPI